MLAANGYQPMDTMIFPDHHAYDDGDVHRLLERARQVEANGFVTTEKDAVKLSPLMRDHLETLGPIIVVRLSVELLDEQDSLAQLIGMAGSAGPPQALIDIDGSRSLNCRGISIGANRPA